MRASSRSSATEAASSQLSSPPDASVFEVSVFGPGKGESIVLHLGNDDWIVVDSCLNPDTGEPVALEYLESLGKDPAEVVRCIVATHGHDDHIGGMAKIVSSCPNAEFWCSDAHSRAEFRALIRMEAETPEIPMSVFEEFREVFDILELRAGGRPKMPGFERAIEGRRVFARPSGSVPEAEVVVLSPSSAAVTLAQQEIGDLIESQVDDTPRRLRGRDQNEYSVTLLVRLGDRRAVLGADLTPGPGAACGWNRVTSRWSSLSDSRACVWKVAHHGSHTCDHAGIWSTICVDHPIAVLTPYRRGSGLPTPNDVDRLCQMASHVYGTATPDLPTKPRAIKRAASELSPVGRNVKSRMDAVVGQVQLRASQGDGAWRVALRSPARSLCA